MFVDYSRAVYSGERACWSFRWDVGNQKLLPMALSKSLIPLARPKIVASQLFYLL
jgi:hypothetical protein